MLPNQQANKNNDISRTLPQRPVLQFSWNKTAVAQRARCKDSKKANAANVDEFYVHKHGCLRAGEVCSFTYGSHHVTHPVSWGPRLQEERETELYVIGLLTQHMKLILDACHYRCGRIYWPRGQGCAIPFITHDFAGKIDHWVMSVAPNIWVKRHIVILTLTKGKAMSLQGLRSPGGAGCSNFKTVDTWRWWGCHPYAPVAPTSHEISLGMSRLQGRSDRKD